MAGSSDLQGGGREGWNKAGVSGQAQVLEVFAPYPPAPFPQGVRVCPLTMVILALLQGLAEALAQGQVTLSGGTIQKLFNLIGAGPHLQGLRSSTGRGLRGTVQEAAGSVLGW